MDEFTIVLDFKKPLTPQAKSEFLEMMRTFQNMLLETATAFSERDKFDQVEKINLTESWRALFHR